TIVRESKVKKYLCSDEPNSEKALIEYLTQQKKLLLTKIDDLQNKIKILQKKVRNENEILARALKVINDIILKYKDPKTEEVLRNIKKLSSSKIFEIFDIEMQGVEIQ
ncbi:5971_t:CDS:2, partial [Scutellospora calospora]